MHLSCPVVPASATGGGSAGGAVCAAAAKHPPSISAATAAHLALVMEFPLRKSPSPLVARWQVKVQADAVPALPARRRCPMIVRGAAPPSRGERVMMFILSLNFTDHGIRGIKDAPKRVQASRELAKKVGVEIKQVYLTSGESDLLVMLETPNGDNVAKFALALGMLGNVHTRTCRAWPAEEFMKLAAPAARGRRPTAH